MTRESHDQRVAAARAERLAAQVRHLQEENRRLRREVEAVRSSETFRVGARILAVPRWIKQRLEARRRSRSRSRPGDRVVRHTAGGRMHAPVADVVPASDARVRDAYRRFLRRQVAEGGVVLRVSTLDLDAGRGDLYVAVGLGRALARRDVDVGLVDHDGPWDVSPGTFVNLVAPTDAPTDLVAMDPSVRRVAWVRNNVDGWLADPQLPLYDLVMASSQQMAGRLARALDRDVPVLPIGVDLDLFGDHEPSRRRPRLVSTMSQFSRDSPRPLFHDLLQADIDVPLRLFGVLNGIPADLQRYAGGQVDFTAIADVYRQSTLVLDEPQSRNRQGGVNSRVFESLASGALPLTRPTVALEELGLDGVPTFTDAESLAAQVHRWSHGTERDELVGRLRDHVRGHHSYEVRASTFLDLLAGVEGRSHPVLGFFPDYRATNPFQELLYRDARADMSVVPVPGPERLRLAAAAGRPCIFHLHWTAPIIGHPRSERDARRRVEAFLARIDDFLHAGGRLVWTIHNAMPHECPYPDLEAQLRAGVAARAHRIHVLGPETLATIGERYDVPGDRVVHVGHGSFQGVYPDLTTEADARLELGLPAGDRVVLVFGQVRAYKGIDRLLDLWPGGAPSGTCLLVVGSVGRDAMSRELARRIAAEPGVISHLAEVPDVDVQRYLRASDVVLLPHTAVLNSGVVHLASAFGRPVVAPDVGNMRAHACPDARLLYEPSDTGLEHALAQLPTLDGEGPRRAAHAHAAAYTAADMSRGFREFVVGDLQPGR